MSLISSPDKENHWDISAKAKQVEFPLMDRKEDVKLDGQPKLDGRKNDEGKPKLGLISTVFMWGMAKVMTANIPEYGEHNWRKGMEWDRPYNAVQRHLTAWWDGQDLDPKSKVSHLWHAACELMFLVEYEAKGIGKDTRWKGDKDAS